MNFSDPENSENEFSIKFKEEYKKMLEREKEYTEHLQNCDLKYNKITRSILKNDLSKKDIGTKK